MLNLDADLPAGDGGQGVVERSSVVPLAGVHDLAGDHRVEHPAGDEPERCQEPEVELQIVADDLAVGENGEQRREVGPGIREREHVDHEHVRADSDLDEPDLVLARVEAGRFGVDGHGINALGDSNG